MSISISLQSCSDPQPMGLRRRLRAARDFLLNVALTGGGPIRRLSFARPSAHGALAEQCVLVTGASSGIGRALALLLAERRVRLVLVARSAPRLQDLQAEIVALGGEARVYVADLSSPTSTDALLAQLERDEITVDVLVNNAGRSIRRPIAEAYRRNHDYERTMALNYFGAVRLTLGLLPGMRERKRGQIVNVSSAGVLVSSPYFSAYVASKAALDAFARVAATETRRDNVHFTTIHMPLVRTPMVAPTEAYAALPMLSAQQAAELVLQGMLSRERQLGTWLAGAAGCAYAIAPGLVETWIGRGHDLLSAA